MEVFIPGPPAIMSAINSLYRYQDDDILAASRKRFDDDLPAYPESGNTTVLPTPRTPPPDPFEEERLRKRAAIRSVPAAQFEQQVILETKRIEHEDGLDHFGKRLTLSHDRNLDSRWNSRNNIHEIWSKMGIWAEEWTATDSMPLGYDVGRMWAHECSPPTSRSASPETTQPKKLLSIPMDSGGWLYVKAYQKVNARDRQASKPVNQFLAQVDREKQWLTDELTWQPRQNNVDVDNLAHQEVKNRWIEDGIWSSDWENSDLPGEAWAHERYNKETVELIESHRKALEKGQPTTGSRHDRSPETMVIAPAIAAGLPRKRKHGAEDGLSHSSTTTAPKRLRSHKVPSNPGNSLQAMENSDHSPHKNSNIQNATGRRMD